jgi:hypothetical protein
LFFIKKNENQLLYGNYFSKYTKYLNLCKKNWIEWKTIVTIKQIHTKKILSLYIGIEW